jgi:ABC-type sulfate/molybdate transport systems ATPase subunit
MIPFSRDFGVAVLIIEKNVRELLKIARRVYVLGNGLVSFSGTAQSLIDDSKLRQAYLWRWRMSDILDGRGSGEAMFSASYINWRIVPPEASRDNRRRYGPPHCFFRKPHRHKMLGFVPHPDQHGLPPSFSSLNQHLPI